MLASEHPAQNYGKKGGQPLPIPLEAAAMRVRAAATLLHIKNTNVRQELA